MNATWNRVRFSLLFLITLACGSAAFAEPAESRPADNLRSRQEAQQRARQMARELVSSVLEVQLQQLEENGLKELPLHRDIQGMRENLSKLVETEMAQVVELLTSAQQGDSRSREKSFKDARRLIRDIVVRLSYERQMLLRRLKTAELAAQTRRVIELETKTADATKGLSDQPQARREMAALQTIEDQRDVKELVVQLIDSLSDVSKWDGPIGTAAGEGLQILNTSGVGKELDAAEKRLETTNYSEAVTSQQAVIRGLQQLLAKLEATRGLLDADRDAALAAVKQAIEKQQTLRDETKKAEVSRTDPEKLVAQQSDVARDLQKLAEALADQPAAQQAVEQAREAATEARTDLFESKLNEAMADQDKVLANLEKAADLLATDSADSEPARSAEQMAQRVKDLEAAAREMSAIQKQQAEAHRAADEKQPVKTGQQEEKVADALDKVAQKRDLPASVEAKLAAAAEAARNAEQSAKSADEHRRDAGATESAAATEQMQREVAKTDDAVEMAAAEINATLADAKRQAEAIKIGELARAAEVLERAAATERQIARDAKATADGREMNADETRDQIAKQNKVNDVAEQVAKAIEHTASRAADQTRKAMESGKAAGRELESAAKQPGESSKPASAEAAKRADKAAAELQQAAKTLRNEIGETAKGLAGESAKQREQVAAVKDDVMQALPDGEASAKQSPLSDKAKPLASKAAAVDAPATSALQSAAKSKPASKPGEQPTDEEIAAAQGEAQRALERAAASLAAREQRVRRDQAIAEAIARMAEEQQQAVEQLAKAPAKDSDTSAAMAQQQFAQTQRATGQGAAEVAGQSEVANPPLREALQMASNLSHNPKPSGGEQHSQPAGDSPANASPANGQPSTNAQPSGKGSPPSGKSGSPGSGQPSDSQTSSAAPSEESPTAAGFDPSLGTGFVPNSPELTAQMIAGRDLAQALAAMAANAAAPQPGQANAAGQPAPGSHPRQPTADNAASSSQAATQGQTSPTATGGNTKGGQLAQNQAVKDGVPIDAPGSPRDRDSRTGDGGSRDADNAATPFQNEPWFAKLPPDLRKAIRARSQRPPPRGYEQRLQRYFESLD